MSKTFTIKRHTEKILKNLWKKCDEASCDVVLIADNETKRIPAHRLILSEASEYFQIMFSTSLRESATKAVKISTVNGDILQSLIDYCYIGRITIGEDNVLEFLKTAHMLLLTDVVTACGNYLAEHLHPSNALGFMLLAEQYNCYVLLKKAKAYCLKHFMSIYWTDEFRQLSVEQLKQYIASDDLSVSAEEYVFDSVIQWMGHDCSRKREREHKLELLKLVRWPFVDRIYFSKRFRRVCDTDELKQFYTKEYTYNAGIKYCNNTAHLKDARKPYQVWMCIRQCSEDSMCMQYYCPQRQKWIKWWCEFEFRPSFSVGCMGSYVYIIGGFDAEENSLKKVTCLSLTFGGRIRKLPPMLVRRINCAVAELDGFLYAVGGRNDEDGLLNSVERWNVETKEWQKVAPMSVKRNGAGIAVLNKKLYVVGGRTNRLRDNTAECYDPIHNTWTSIKQTNECRFYHEVTAANGLLYAVGGCRSKTVERYDPQTNKWTYVCSLSEELPKISVCTTINDKVVVSFRNHFEEYDAVSNKWKKFESLQRPYDLYALFSYSGKLLLEVFGEMKFFENIKF